MVHIIKIASGCNEIAYSTIFEVKWMQYLFLHRHPLYAMFRTDGCQSSSKIRSWSMSLVQVSVLSDSLWLLSWSTLLWNSFLTINFPVCTCQLFLRQMREIFTFIKPGISDYLQTLTKTSEDVLAISERQRRLTKVLWFFPKVAKDFRRCCNYFRTSLKISKAGFNDFLIPKILNKHSNVTFSIIYFTIQGKFNLMLLSF